LGIEQGLREVADAAQTPLILYLKEEINFGSDKEAGLDAVARLVEDGLCVAIKYAVVRENPAQDQYLESLLKRVDRNLVISGMGERPAIVHLRDWKLPGFTTGSGCLAPRMCNDIFRLCSREEYSSAERLRAHFMPLEDLRDAWNPARVLHSATLLSGVADTGPVPPFLSNLDPRQIEEISRVAGELVKKDEVPLPT
jgi:dihydrodipicolinate synthase/N-acetylneuraminate lyase